MKEEYVVFKGTKEGLTVILKEDVTFDELKKHFENKVKSLKTFLSGSKITVKFSRKLDSEEVLQLVDIIKTKGKAEVLMVIDEDSLLSHGNAFESILEGNAKIYKGTLRSGQSINYNGNVIIVGDINAGAEVIAAGNIIILGIARGTICAGAGSNNEAFIAGLSLKPTGIRIGEIIGSPVYIESMKGQHPEVIEVKEGVLQASRLRME